jgi:hypothetical protein
MGSLHAKVGVFPSNWVSDRVNWLLVLALLLWTCQAAFMVSRVDTWLDEGMYLIKSASYALGRTKPYSIDDPTSYPPLYFLTLGTAQRIFGEGHLTGRILSVLFSLSSIVLLYIAALRCLGNKFAAGIAVLVFALNPMAVAYMSTATPYALVTLLTLASFLFVTRSEMVPLWAKAPIMGSLAASLILTRINLFVTLPLFAALYLIVQRDNIRIALLILIAAIIFAAGWITLSISYFGGGLAETLLYVPGIDRFLWRWSTVGSEMHDVITLTHSPNDLDFSWSVVNEVVYRYFVQLYPTILIPAISGIVLVLLCDGISLTSFCAVYFIIMTAAHLIGSQRYCPPCVMAYTNYVLAFAAIPAAYFLSAIAARLPRNVTIAVFVFGAAFGTYFASQKRNIGMLVPTAWDNPLKIEARLAESTKGYLPEGRILALSGSYQTFQAIWLAGGELEPYSIAFLPSIREPRADLDPATKTRAEEALTLRGFRTSDGVIRDLRRPMSAVVVQERPAIFEALIPYVGAQNAQRIHTALLSGYNRVAEITVGDKSISIWRQK